jgi:hypothetical protein BACCOPRO_03219
MSKTNISVVIPVYKVEEQIRKCVQSLFAQSLETVEFIFVDDASPDKSIAIIHECLKNYPNRTNQTKFLRHPHNKGLPAARNTGMLEAVGDYIFHCDSDDFLDRTALEDMYNAAKESDSDFVWCDWYLSFERNERYMKQPSYSTPMEALKGTLGGAMKYNVWNKLVKRSLYVENSISFPEGYSMGEDMTMAKLIACAQKICYLPHAYYHYRKANADSFTNTKKEQSKLALQASHNVEDLISFLIGRYGDALDKEIAFFKLNVKFPLLITSEVNSYKQWLSLYPEADQYIKENHFISNRARVLQRLAKNRFFWLLKLHYYICYKLVYGVIFR